MDKNTLTNEQIESLFLFCGKHYVEYYDLQVELVDHLASEIEAMWKNQPEMSFQQALDKSFGEFGIFGFSKIKEEKKRALQKRYRNITFQYFLSFFKLPKIILTILLTVVLSVLLHFTSFDGNVIFFMLLFLLLGGIIYLLWLFPKYYKMHLIPGEKFLLIDQFNSIQAILIVWPAAMLNTSSFLFHLNKYAVFTTVSEILVSFFLVVFVLFLYAFGFYLPAKIKEHFTEQFPQFVKV